MEDRNDVLGFFESPAEKDPGEGGTVPTASDTGSDSQFLAGPLPDLTRERAGFEDLVRKNPRLRPFVENALYYLEVAYQAAGAALAVDQDDSIPVEERTARARVLNQKRRENLALYYEALKDLGLFPRISPEDLEDDEGLTLVQIHRKYIGEVKAMAGRRKQQAAETDSAPTAE